MPETRTNDVIRAVVQQHRAQIRRCYEAALDAQPELRGTLTLRFTLDPNGKVTSAEVNPTRTTLQDPRVQQCALAALRTIQFPASSRGFESSVNYPFDFKP